MSVIFHRTPSGLTNLAVFLGVDAVVYIEGGEKQYSISELEVETAPSENYDAMFWRTAFKVVKPRLKLHFKSIGSKTSVLSVSQLIRTNAIQNVITALDRDLDHIRRTKIKHPNVLYTYGYSWENDVLTKANIKTFCQRYCLGDQQTIEIEQFVEKASNEFSRAFSVFIAWDHALARSGLAVCDRDSLKNTIELRPPGPPQISRSKIARMLRASCLQHRSVRLSNVRSLSAWRDLHGHTLERFCLGVIQHLMATVLDVKSSNDGCMRLLIGLFEKDIRGTGYTSRHYKKSISSITVRA